MKPTKNAAPLSNEVADQLSIIQSGNDGSSIAMPKGNIHSNQFLIKNTQISNGDGA